VPDEPARPRTRLAPSSCFARRAKKLPPEQQPALARALRLFQADPHDPRLGTDKRSGPLAGLWAFSFGYDARVVFEWDGDVAVLLNVGSHDEVYG
jgi:mRNA-degrading endonuclease YafQ of YafQ-DinJ toxin-antitoxin module